MVFLITIMHIFLVKAIDIVKDLITLKRWRILAGVTDVKTSSFGYIYTCHWLSLDEHFRPTGFIHRWRSIDRATLSLSDVTDKQTS